MREIIRKVPIPTAGVALGLAALGNLLQPYTEIVHIVCGILSLVLIAMLGAKIALFPDMIRDDLHNSIMASVSATLFMTLMQRLPGPLRVHSGICAMVGGRCGAPRADGLVHRSLHLALQTA